MMMLKYLLSLALFLLPTTALACQQVQWIVGVTATGQGSFPAKTVDQGTRDRNGVIDETMRMDHPYALPADKTLAITSVLFAQKHSPRQWPQHSHFILFSWFNVPSNIGTMNYNPPLRLPGGTNVRFVFTNAAAVGQNMFGTVIGYLSGFEDLRDCPL